MLSILIPRLDSNVIGDKGAIALTESLEVNCSLKELK